MADERKGRLKKRSRRKAVRKPEAVATKRRVKRKRRRTGGGPGTIPQLPLQKQTVQDRRQRVPGVIPQTPDAGPTPPAQVRRETQRIPGAAKSKDEAPIVTVFGAGIAGLSVAHELIERGFVVQVVEKHRSDDREYECEVGGMARSQFGRIKADLVRLHPYLFPEEAAAAGYLACVEDGEIEDPEAKSAVEDPEEQRRLVAALQRLRSVRMQPVQKRFAIPQRIRFSRSPGKLDLERDDDHGVTNGAKLDQVVEKIRGALAHYARDLDVALKPLDDDVKEALADPCVRRRETLLIDIRGHTDGDGEPSQNRKLGLRWAAAVRDHLVEKLVGEIPEIAKHLVVRSFGSLEPDAGSAGLAGRERSNRVDFQVVEQVIPGEHGYRFFPAYYRHLFDVMRRTPLLDPSGLETAATAFDQLVAPPSVAMALEDTKHFHEISRRRPRSLEELRILLGVLLDKMGITAHDMNRYQTQLLKFMTSSWERRSAIEELSWLAFMDGKREPLGGKPGAGPGEPPSSRKGTTKYSQRAEHLLSQISQALIAMDATETDAYTHGLTSVQLLLDYLDTAGRTDMTLNGPTSFAWLQHWKNYLRRQGVRFFVGEIERLEWSSAGELVPEVKGPGPKGRPRPEITPQTYLSHEADESELTPDFYVLAVPFEVASDLVWDCPDPEKLEGSLRQLRVFDRKTGHKDEHGEDLLVRDESGRPSGSYPLRDLSGIQYYFPNQVRVGAGHVVYPDSAWGLSSISQLAHWRERRARGGGYLGLLSADIGDFYGEYKQEDGQKGKTGWNSTRQEIAENVWQQILKASQREYAKHVEPPSYYHLDDAIDFEDPWDPGAGTPRGNRMPFLISPPGQWKHRPGLKPASGEPPSPEPELPDVWYEVANRRWMLAGTYMATYTRLTTMEAANESARHAVTAILLHLMKGREGKASDARCVYNGEGKLLGEVCETWDPEKHEIQDLEPLKRLDKLLFEQGLPHFLDILGVLELLDRTQGEKPVTDRPIATLAKLLQTSGGAFASEWPSFHDEIAQGIYNLIKSLVTDLLGVDPKAGELLRELAATLLKKK